MAVVMPEVLDVLELVVVHHMLQLLKELCLHFLVIKVHIILILVHMILIKL